MGFVDLHIHTVYSDSTVTPAEAVRLAADTGVTLMAVCDHNVLTGSVEAQAEAKKAGIVCLTGVEVDCLFLGSDTHVLAYGCDFENAEFVKSVKHARWALDNMSEELLEKLAKEAKDRGTEFISVFYGEDVSAEVALTAEKTFSRIVSNAEVSVLSGGQPVYYYIISME